jgi:ABC-type glycerol-3-phosphate transport system substrate-binding protein
LKNLFKKTTAAMLAAVMMIVIFAGCGQESANVKYSDTSHLFSQSEITIPSEYIYIQGSAYANGKFYLMASREEMKLIPIPEGGHPYAEFMSPEQLSTASDGTPIPDGMMETSINYTTMIIADENGNIESTKDLSKNDYMNPEPEIAQYGMLFTSPDGKLLSEKRVSKAVKDADGNETYESTQTIISFDENLSETEYFNIGKALETMAETERQQYYAQEMMFIGDYLYSLSYNGVYVFDVPNEKYLFSIVQEQNNSGNGDYYQGVFNLGGVAAVSVQSQSQEGDVYTVDNYLKTIDVNTRAFGTTQYDFSEAQNGNAMRGNDDYPIVIATGSKLYSFDYLTGEQTLLIDFLASGYTVENFENIMIMGSDRFSLIVSEWNYIPVGINSWSGSTTTTKIIMLDKIPEEEVKPRQLVTIYCFYENRNFLQYAADFNKKSDEYEIQLVSYNTDYSEDIEDVITRLNNDILSGNIPDILLLETSMPYDSYAAKGVFWDLNKSIEKDDEIKREDFNESILNLLETDGKLYSIPKEYAISGLMGKASIFGDTDTLTPEKVAEVTAAYPDASLFGFMTQSSLISTLVTAQLGSYVNKDTGEVTFDTPEFIEILNLAKTLPAEIDYENVDYREYEKMFFENKALLNTMYVSDFRALVQTKYTQFGEDITIMGYPNPNNSGILIMPSSTEMAIMARGNRDAAWEVVKGFLQYKAEDERYSYGLSIWRSELEATAEAAKKPMTYVDPVSGKTVEVKNLVNSGSPDEIEFPNNTDADNQVIFDLIENAGAIQRTDVSLNKIIEEETSAFFAGSKTAEECAKLIQDRASTYIAESR